MFKIILTNKIHSFQKPFDTIVYKSNQTKCRLALFGVQKVWDNLIKTYISRYYLVYTSSSMSQPALSVYQGPIS